jgi:thioredoxin-like negative regulator of GroEL
MQEYYAIAKELNEKGNWKSSIQYLKTCLELNPFQTEINIDIAQIYFLNSEKEKAYKQFESLLKKKEDERNYFLYAKFLCKIERFKLAIKVLNLSLKKNKLYLPSHLLMAEIYTKLEMNQKAKQFLMNVVKIDSSDFESLDRLLNLCYKSKDYNLGLEILSKYNFSDIKYQVYKVKLYLNLNQDDKANEVLDQIFTSKSFDNFIKAEKLNAIEMEKLTVFKNSRKEKLLTTNDFNLQLELSLINLFLGDTDSAKESLFNYLKSKIWNTP